MDYAEALRRTYALAPKGIQLGLDRVRTAADALGAPHKKFPAVQIAGTNGKGTVASLVAHAAHTSGLRVGLFTSPHLHRFAERIRLDGEEADQRELAEQLTRVLALSEGAAALPLTFFETATLAAFGVFAEQEVDLAVLEVGLGGRLDATTIADPLVCAITSIGLDHTEILGSTTTAIAAEKAGIARPGIPLVVGQLDPEPLAEIDRAARSAGSPLLRYGRDFVESFAVKPPWPGTHQRRNVAVAREITQQLSSTFAGLTDELFADAVPSTAWPGRYETVTDGDRKLILDGAHNLEAILALVDALDERGDSPDAVIFGALRGKPVDAMLELLAPQADQLVLAPPPIDRSFAPGDHAERHGAWVAPDVAAALDRCRSGTVLVTGSLFVVAEARRIVLDEVADPPIGL
ncbi:MAG: bifunctional folylpolyglutamate synthase/dihydrofolate synthase [Deltaproteobacteria bacterium]|nr:bifunctional folylpolyglutamate synthase/dihydrofolate synthase [Deltaproteobacteria bacterium]